MKYIVDLSWWKAALLGFASALLLLLAHPMREWGIFHDWFPLAFVALIPLFVVLLSQGWGKSLIALTAYVALFYGVYLEWLTRFHTLALPGITFGVLLYHLAALAAFRLASRKWPEWAWLILVLSFTLLEYSRSIGFLRFPYGSLAYSQYQFLPFIQFADLGGYLLVSMVLYLFNALGADFLVRFRVSKNRALFLARRRDLYLNRFTALAALLLVILAYGVYRLSFDRPQPGRTLRVGLVQNWFDFNKPWTPENKAIVHDQLTLLSRKASLASPDLIVWPESAMLLYYEKWCQAGYFEATMYRDFFKGFNQGGGSTWFLSGTLDMAEPRNAVAIAFTNARTNKSAKGQKTGTLGGNREYYNAVILLDAAGQVVDRYYKHLLVAFAEWFPYGDAFPAVARLLKQAQASDFTPGRAFTVFRHPKAAFAALICYEDVFAEFCRRFVEEGAEVLIVITNDAWSYTETPQQVHYMFSVFRAVENRRPVLRAANAGVTAILDPCGRSLSALPQFVEDVLVGDVDVRPARSLWQKFGASWMALVGAALALFFILSFFRGRLEAALSRLRGFLARLKIRERAP